MNKFLLVILSFTTGIIPLHAIDPIDLEGEYYQQHCSGRYSYIFNTPDRPSDTSWHPYLYSDNTVRLETSGHISEDGNGRLAVDVRLCGLLDGTEELEGTADLGSGEISFPLQPVYDFYTFASYDPETSVPLYEPAVGRWENNVFTIENWTAQYDGWTYIRDSRNIYVKDTGAVPDMPLVEMGLEHGADGKLFVKGTVTAPVTGDTNGDTGELNAVTRMEVEFDFSDERIYDTLSYPGKVYEFEIEVDDDMPAGEFSLFAVAYHCNRASVPAIFTASVEGIAADRDATLSAPVYYDLSGRRVTDPAPGIYIRQQGSTRTKVLIR